MSWADPEVNEQPAEHLSLRISELEHTVSSQLAELRNEVGLAAAAMRAAGPGAGIGDLEQQLSRAVSVSLSAALDTIREALTEAIADAVAHLSLKLEATIATEMAGMVAKIPEPPPPQVLRPQLDAADLEPIAASLQHSVLLALDSFEAAHAPPAITDAMDAPATARDLAAVKKNIDELSAQLGAQLKTTAAASDVAGVKEHIDGLRSQMKTMVAQIPKAPPQVLRPQWDPSDLETIAAALQHSVLLALSSFEQASTPAPSTDPMEAPATARDVARVTQHLDDLRSLLLG